MAHTPHTVEQQEANQREDVAHLNAPVSAWAGSPSTLKILEWEPHLQWITMHQRKSVL